MKTHKLISIVIPIYNEGEVLPELYRKLLEVTTGISYTFEFIFVNDGSKDKSWQLIYEFYLTDKERVKGISFSRNFGHQAALTAGMDFAQGDCVISMDGDLQHPPELIPKLIQEWEAGNEVVLTIREETKKESLFKKITSRIFYKIFRKLSTVEMEPSAADFRLLDRKVVDSIKQLRERVRFLRGMISWVGYKQKSIKYTAESRWAGTSKYTLKKMISFALDGITSFSTVPLQITSLLGFIITALSFAYGVYAIIMNIVFQRTIQGWTSLMLVILIMGGIQLITLGILGEYLAKNFEEAKRRPIYIVSDALGIKLQNEF